MHPRPRSRTTPYVPLDARRGQGDARPFSILRPRAADGPCGPIDPLAPSMLLIDAVERRFRSRGYEPIRSFDARRRWRLEVDGQVIAAGQSLSELARAAHQWLEARTEAPG